MTSRDYMIMTQDEFFDPLGICRDFAEIHIDTYIT